MASSQVATHRKRMRQRGFVRLELRVRADDATLLRRVVRALADPLRSEAIRGALIREIGAVPTHDLKALLAMAPLEGIDLDRTRDTGREVDLLTWLIDTNVISEVRKGSRCHPAVASWYEGVRADDLYLSVLVLGEIRRGLELARREDPEKASALERWLKLVVGSFADRVLPVDRSVADAWGKISAIRTVPSVDGLLVATAKVHHLTLVTCNRPDVAGLGVDVLNPFEASA